MIGRHQASGDDGSRRRSEDERHADARSTLRRWRGREELDDEPREAFARHLFTVTVNAASDCDRAATEQRLLADVGKIMVDAGADTERLLQDVAAAVTHEVADWCRLDVDGDGDTRRVRVVHRDGQKLAVCEALERHAAVGAGAARERPLLVRDVGTPYLEANAADDEHLRLLLALGIGSFVVVPLVARGQTLGTLSFGLSDPRRPCTVADVGSPSGSRAAWRSRWTTPASTRR